MDLIVLFLLYGGGIAVAFVLMLLASRRISRSSVIGFAVLALLCLLLQEGCWRVASGIGGATGGGGGGNAWGAVSLAGFVVCAIWFLILLSTRNR